MAYAIPFQRGKSDMRRKQHALLVAICGGDVIEERIVMMRL